MDCFSIICSSSKILVTEHVNSKTVQDKLDTEEPGRKVREQKNQSMSHNYLILLLLYLSNICLVKDKGRGGKGHLGINTMLWRHL